MSRLRTKGATIGVQLPLGTDEWLRTTARERGVSPGTFIGQVIIELHVVSRSEEDTSDTHPV